jgi:regulatory helix-turn-helix LysR family protein
VILFFHARPQQLAGARALPNVFKEIFVNPKIELTSMIQAVTVAERLNFRRAAEALGVCQSSVSKRVIKHAGTGSSNRASAPLG